MRVGAAHCGAFVLEDLHVAVLRVGSCDIATFMAFGREGRCRCNFRKEGVGRKVRSVDLGPGLNNREDFCRLKIGEGEVV